MTSLRLSAIVLLTTTAACSASNGTGVFSTGTGSGGSGGSGGASTASSATGAGDGVGGSFTTGAGGCAGAKLACLVGAAPQTPRPLRGRPGSARGSSKCDQTSDGRN